MTTISFNQANSSFFVAAPRASVSEKIAAVRDSYAAQPHLLGALGTAAGAALAMVPFAALVYAFVAI